MGTACPAARVSLVLSRRWWVAVFMQVSWAMRWLTIILLLALMDGCAPTSSPPPPPVAGWQLGYSTGVTLSQTSGIWSFTFPSYPGHVNMITQSVAGLKGSQITAVFQETESNPVWFWAFDAGNTCPGGQAVHLYFQRAGDDMSGVGDKQYYRWWGPAIPIQPSLGSVTAALAPGLWGSVYGVNGSVQPLMFQQALDNASSVGFTFGGGCFAGHGVALKGGSAAMTLRSFVVQ